jgi:hypothetical protein
VSGSRQVPYDDRVRLADRVAARDAAVFVGRERELAALGGLLEPDGPYRVAVVTGPAGSGKSALLRELRRRAAAAARELVVVEREDADPAELIGGLTDGAALVVARRRPPDPAWWSAPWASSALLLALEPLPPTDAAALLAALGGTDPAEVAALVRWADGLPLALVAAAAVRAGGRPLDERALVRLEVELLDHLTDGLLADPGLLTRDRMVLAVAALTPAVDAELLAAVLPDSAPGTDAERWLRGLPFAERVGLRVALAQRVRRLLVRRLRREDAELERRLRLRIVDHLADPIRQRRPHVLVDVREVLALAVDRGVTPSMTREATWRIEGVREGDAELLPGLLRSDPEHLCWVQRWLREAPEHVVVVRRPDQPTPAAVAVWLTPAAVPAAFRADPRLSRWLAWLAERDPSGNALVNPVTEVAPGPDGDEVGRLVLHALAERCGLPDLGHWLTTRRPHAPDPAHCGGVHVRALDLSFGAETVTGWDIDYGARGAVAWMQAQAHAELRSVGDAGPLRTSYDVVRDALRSCHDPVALARSPLARGAEPAERAAYVVALLHDAVDRAFGSAPGAQLQRDVLKRGYLDPDADHARAMRTLHLSRTTYFRRLREATLQLAAWLDPTLTPAAPLRAP